MSLNNYCSEVYHFNYNASTLSLMYLPTSVELLYFILFDTFISLYSEKNRNNFMYKNHYFLAGT